MEIIATTSNGFIISATNDEVEAILHGVTGLKAKEIKIGQKIPAIDYASTIFKIKSLHRDYDFKNIFERLESFNKSAAELKLVVEKASSIEA